MAESVLFNKIKVSSFVAKIGQITRISKKIKKIKV